MGLAASRQEAFWEACGFGHVHRARKFLEEGEIDVNWVSYVNDCSPIHVASQGKPEIVQLLLEYKCDVNVKDNRGNLALHHAAMTGHADIVQTLIDVGSEINTQEKNGWTALHNAAYWCHPKVVQILIDNGCDVNIQNKDERTALHEVARSPNMSDDRLGEIAKLLIDAGSDINAKSSDLGEADLTGLMYASYHNHPEVAQALIDAGCELDAVGSTFWTAMHWATDRGHDELVYILVDAGANPLRKNMRGETAADRAQTDEIREVLINAASMYRELHKMDYPLITNVTVPVVKPVQTYVPKCDANFKSESFLPKDWKPSINLQKLKEIRDKLREQHLKSLKNAAAVDLISQDTGQETCKETRLSSVEPVSRGSSVTTDTASTNSDLDTSSDEELVEEIQGKKDTVNTEKQDIVNANIADNDFSGTKAPEVEVIDNKKNDDVEHDEKTGEGITVLKESLIEISERAEVIDNRKNGDVQQADEKTGDGISALKGSPVEISERADEHSTEEFKTGDNISVGSRTEDDFESLSVISNLDDKEEHINMPEEEVNQAGDCKQSDNNGENIENMKNVHIEDSENKTEGVSDICESHVTN